MQREGFSHRRTTTKKKKNMSSKETVASITRFFLDTRVFHLRHPEIMPCHVYNRDQVPMALASSYATTIDDTNKDVIWDSTFDASDTKRFCTLNLTIPMEVSDDRSNLIRPHLVFKATKYYRGEDWTVKNDTGIYERDLWEKRVDVSFQSNAWVDAQTNLYGLSKAKPVLDAGDQTVWFEDNLSSHKTAAVLQF